MESLPWLILGLPLLTAAAIHLGLKKKQSLSALVSTCSAAVDSSAHLSDHFERK